MLKVTSLEACARPRTRLVHDDHDRWRLLSAILDQFQATVLSYCIMDTHVHLIVDMEADRAATILTEVVRAYAHWFLGRHRLAPPLLGGPITFRPKDTEDLLAKAIHYVHQNPVKASMVRRAVHFPWSSARQFGNLSQAPFPDVQRALFLLGGIYSRAQPDVSGLVAGTLRPGQRAFSPVEILLASAAALSTPADLVVRSSRFAPAVRARAAFARLGELEGFTKAELGLAIGMTRQRIGQLQKVRDDDAVALARTHLVNPELRQCLGAAPEIPSPRRYEVSATTTEANEAQPAGTHEPPP